MQQKNKCTNRQTDKLTNMQKRKNAQEQTDKQKKGVSCAEPLQTCIDSAQVKTIHVKKHILS